MENRRVSRWLGVITLAGVIASIFLIGLLLAALHVGKTKVLGWLLPLTYIVVIVMGVLLLLRLNPFIRLPMIRSPRFKNSILSSFVYGMLYGPMAFPCNGGLVVSAFA